jgi:hypothetical protein
MGFNKLYLPSLDDLKKLHNSLGDSKFLDYLEKYDTMLGDIESHNYILNFLNTIKK